MYSRSKLLMYLCVSSLLFSTAVAVETVIVASVAAPAAQANPCAAKTNPCAAKKNPCAAKTNPCAAKTTSVGGPLAKELQGEPLIVDVYASWCAACKNIEPTLSELRQQYGDKVNFVVLDVSDKAKAAASEQKAKQLGLGKFLEANKAQTGTVAIIDPATGNILAQHYNNPDRAAYTEVITKALK
ncbi:TlpA family protein disulfide reductase [Gloeobacter morelensis]|uniref:Redoxin domain-containing protein n=1 Tax=Gloeobacter morelensis MG652769 TaxID=2781736 RepID=A0ABY3PR67_9CYAN|nr:redoxin domain-containing protein [Gloeobacter morelensis MG652769]